MSKRIELDLEVKRMTDNAMLLSDGDVMEWVPTSQLDGYSECICVGDTDTFSMPEWIAKEKGFI